MNKIIRVLILLNIIWAISQYSPRFAEAAPDCQNGFSELAKIIGNNTSKAALNIEPVAQQISVLSNSGRDRVVSERGRLREFLNADLQNAKATGSVPLSEKTITSVKRLAAIVRSELEGQGFKVRTSTRPMVDFVVDSKLIILPEREVLLIEAGQARGPFARELRNLEKYTATRINDSTLPEKIRALDFSTSYDPALSAVLQSNGHFVVSPSLGTGMNLSTTSFISDPSLTIEIIRHEKRHLKAYFDVITGKPTVYRSLLVDTTKQGLFHSADERIAKQRQVYGDRFHVEEIDAFRANLRSVQARLGKETEQMQVRLSQETDVSSKDYRRYREKIESLKKAGEHHALTIKTFIASALDNISIARKVLSSARKYPHEAAQRIHHEPKVLYPGLSQVTYNLSDDSSRQDRTLVLFVPEKISTVDAQMNYLLSYLDELEAHTKSIHQELKVREADLARDHIRRLEPLTK